MMLMMKAESDKRLYNNLTGGAALTVFTLAAYLCLIFIADIISIFFETLMIDFTVFGDYSINRLLGSVSGAALMLLTIFPLKLNIKRWYQGIDGEHLPLSSAFSYFKNSRDYLSALSYSVLKFIITAVCFALPVLPAVLITAFLKSKLVTDNAVLGVLIGTLIVIAAVFTFAVVLYSLYILIGFFLSDYLYIKLGVKNAVKAMAMSQKILKGARIELLKVIFSMLPYYIFCLALVPVPFMGPKIKTRLAVFADKTIEKYNGGQQCQF